MTQIYICKAANPSIFKNQPQTLRTRVSKSQCVLYMHTWNRHYLSIDFHPHSDIFTNLWAYFISTFVETNIWVIDHIPEFSRYGFLRACGIIHSTYIHYNLQKWSTTEHIFHMFEINEGNSICYEKFISNFFFWKYYFI